MNVMCLCARLRAGALSASALHRRLVAGPEHRLDPAARPPLAAPQNAERGSLPGAPGAYVDAVLADKPIAFYRLMETSGVTAYDTSGNGHNGTYDGQVTLGQPALLRVDKAATSVSFPQGYVGEQATWTAQAVTAECWVRPTAADLQATPRILDNAWTDHDGDGFMLWIRKHTAGFNTGWLGDVRHVRVPAGTRLRGRHVRRCGRRNAIHQRARARQCADRREPTESAAGRRRDHLRRRARRERRRDRLLPGRRRRLRRRRPRVDGRQGGAALQRRGPRTRRPARPAVARTDADAASTDARADADRVRRAERVHRRPAFTANDVLPAGKGEFETSGLDRSWWGRQRTIRSAAISIRASRHGGGATSTTRTSAIRATCLPAATIRSTPARTRARRARREACASRRSRCRRISSATPPSAARTGTPACSTRRSTCATASSSRACACRRPIPACRPPGGCSRTTASSKDRIVGWPASGTSRRCSANCSATE